MYDKVIPLTDFTTSSGEVAEDQLVQDIEAAIPARTILDCNQDFVNEYIQFDDILTPPQETTLAGIVSAHTATGRVTHGAVADLSTGMFEGEDGYATNGRKVGEGGGSGTGVPIYWSDSAWRVFSTDAAVQS